MQRKQAIWPGLIALAGALLALAVPAGAQQSGGSHIAFDFPAGGRQGSSVNVVIGGQALLNTTGVYVSGDGVTGSVASIFRPLTGKEELDIRDKLAAARDKLLASGVRPIALRLDTPDGLARLANAAGISDDDLKAFLDMARRRNDPKIQLNPQLAQSVTVKVDIAPDAAPGMRELRLQTPAGLTNPVHFVVGKLAEISQKSTTGDPVSVAEEMPLVLNGQILPGEVDHYRFHGRKGTALSAICQARALTPYIADTVPGWFQAAMTLYAPDGREVAYADHYLFHQDPAFRCTLPADGDYTLEVRDALYRGREDFVYRVALGDLPLSDYVGGFEPPAAPADVPVVQSTPTSDSVARAQAIALPALINGTISEPGAVHVYKVAARAGETLVAEVQARRYGSALDSVVKVTDSAGRLVAMNDDSDDKSAGLVTHQADSYLSTTLKSAGTYYVTIFDAQNKGGAEYGYRLRLSEPRPDFDLLAAPSALTLRPGGAATIAVTVVRRDGFAGDIALSLSPSIPGFRLMNPTIPGKSDTANVSIRAMTPASDSPIPITLVGTARAGDRQLSHAAVAVDDMEQAFAYHHLAPASTWLVSVVRWQRRPLAAAPAAKPAPASASASAPAVKPVAAH